MTNTHLNIITIVLCYQRDPHWTMVECWCQCSMCPHHYHTVDYPRVDHWEESIYNRAIIFMRWLTIIVISNEIRWFRATITGTINPEATVSSVYLTCTSSIAPNVFARITTMGNAYTFNVGFINCTILDKYLFKSRWTSKLIANDSSTNFAVLTTSMVEDTGTTSFWISRRSCMTSLQADGHCCEGSLILRWAIRYHNPAPHCGSWEEMNISCITAEILPRAHAQVIGRVAVVVVVTIPRACARGKVVSSLSLSSSSLAQKSPYFEI